VAALVADSQTRAPIAPFWLAWCASVTFFAGFYALLVPLPRYLANVGLSDWQIGFVLGGFGIASLLGRPLSGVVVDRVGARPTMLAGALALAVGALGIPLTDSFALLAILRVLQAIGYVAFTTAGTSLVVSLTAEERRARRLAAFGAAANIAISLTPAVITALLDVLPLTAGLVASAILAGVAAVLAVNLPRTTGSKMSYTGWLVPRRALWPMLATALFGAGYAAFFQFAPILADRRALPAGLLYGVYGAAIIATRFAAGRLLDRLRVAHVVLAAAAFMAIGLYAIAWSTALLPIAVAVALVAVSGGLFHPALLAHHAALLPETPGRASAAFYIAFDLGIGVGSWIFGVVLQESGISGMYVSGALFACIAALIAWRL
jgi:predicted MFS family arabinose efflux permease